MERAGVPVIPGTRIVPDVPAALQAAEEVGYPIMLKARAGGGGRGIRMVQKPGDMESAFQVAAQESQSAFGDNTLYLEKCIYPARHIEVQVLADEAHHCVCLGSGTAPSSSTTRSSSRRPPPRPSHPPSAAR